jgi:O-antigen ligase
MIAFTLPFARLMQIFIIILILNWLVEGNFRNKFKTLIKNKFALLFFGFYIIHLIGLLYTENINSGLFDVQVKLTLFLFPLVLCSSPPNENNVKAVFHGLIGGGFLSSLLMIVIALTTYFGTGENHFFYTLFSFYIHPSYFSMYLNVCIVWLFLVLLKNVRVDSFFQGWTIPVIIYFSFIIVLLSSKLGIITLLLIYISILLFFILSRRKYLVGVVGFLTLILGAFLIMKYVPAVADRLNTTISVLSNEKTNKSDAESTAVRMLVWSAAGEIIKENPLLGVGTGDAKDELLAEYEKEDLSGAMEHKLNCHNEFYQVFVSLGIIGFILLLLHIFVPMWHAVRTKDVLYALFLMIIVINFLTESMLETQAGVLFYAFFTSVLCFRTRNNLKTQKID